MCAGGARRRVGGGRNGRTGPVGRAGAVEIAAQACSVGLAGELDSAAQVSCEKAVRKRCARVATRSGHLALFVYAPSMDMLGSALDATERSKSLLERAWKPLSSRNLGSSMFCFHSKAFSSMLLFPSKTLSIMLVFPLKSLSKSLCFELCLASSCTLCDFTGTVRCHMRI